MQIVVDISDMKMTSHEEDTLVTYSLGSCLGFSLYDPVNKIGGMIHCMLPLSKIDPVKAKERPFMFTDRGVTMFLQKMIEQGAKKTNLIAKAAGCANILDPKNLFNIGERNFTVLRKILWKNDILLASHDIGGKKSRTMKLYMDTGITTLKVNGTEEEL